MVPWGALPAQFRDANQFPPNIGLGQRVRGRFASFWVQPALEPRKQRDLMLRGHYHKASPLLNDDSALLNERLKVEEVQARDLAAKGTSLPRAVSEWAETTARPAYAELVAAREKQKHGQGTAEEGGAVERRIAELGNAAVAARVDV